LAVTLELLFADPSSREPERTVVLVQLPGNGAERLGGALLDSARGGRRRLLPSPPPDTPASELRRWHRDAWSALGDGDRSSLVLATGPTAAYLIPALGRRAEPVAFIREPLAALYSAQPSGTPRKRLLRALEGGELDARSQAYLRGWSNPQSRALLAPWHDGVKLGVTSGPPDDAEHWRTLLFEDVLHRVVVARDAVAIARRLARQLGLDPKKAIHKAGSLASGNPSVKPAMPDARYADSLLSLSWLDVELYEHCSEVDGTG
jgi:hypothetical protein